VRFVAKLPFSPLCAITSVDNFVDKKTDHFRSISITFRSKTEKIRKKSQKTLKTETTYLTQTTIAQKILTYLTHLNPNFARFRAATFKLFHKIMQKVPITPYLTTP